MDCSKEQLLNMISRIQFVCIELNLYLNTHPDDENARQDYLCYSEKLRELIDRYEELYGPLKNFGHSPTNAGCWVCSEWPWE